MKFERNPKYNTIAVYTIVVAIIIMVCYQMLGHISSVFGFVGQIVGYIMPLVYGIVFAFLLNPMLRMFDDRFIPFLLGKRRMKRRVKRILSMLLTYLVFFVLISLFTAIVIPQLLASMTSIWNNIPSYFTSINSWYSQLTDFLHQFTLEDSSTEFSQITDDLIMRLLGTMSELVEKTYELLSQSLTAIVSAATTFTTGVVNLVLGIIVSIYILYDREKLFAQLKKLGRAVLPKNIYGLLSDIIMDVHRIFSGFIVGKVIDSLIIGMLCMIGLTILKMPYAVLVSVIVGVTNIIPYFGPFIGAVPATLIILIVDPIKAVWFVIFVLLLQQLDGNVIGPKILGDTVGLCPLWIVTSIMLFSGLLGILGMFIGVPLFAILYSLVKRIVSYLLHRRGESTSTRDYDSEKNPLIR